MLAALRLQVGTSSSNHIEITLLTEHCCDITEISCYMQKNVAEAVTSQLELLVHGGIAEKAWRPRRAEVAMWNRRRTIPSLGRVHYTNYR